MSLKAIELQVALPRTKDAGMQQGQFGQKAVSDQEALAQQTIRQAELERKRALQAEREHALENDKEDSNSDRHQPSNRKPKADKQEEEVVAHPYKGKHIDLTL